MIGDLSKNTDILPQIFSKWIPLGIKDQIKAYEHDTQPYVDDGVTVDRFVPERFMKDEEDIAECEKILKINFTVIHCNYLMALAKSHKCPEIDLKAFCEWFSIMQNRFWNHECEEHGRMH